MKYVIKQVDQGQTFTDSGAVTKLQIQALAFRQRMTEGVTLEILASLSLLIGYLTLINLFDGYQILVFHFLTEAALQFLQKLNFIFVI